MTFLAPCQRFRYCQSLHRSHFYGPSLWTVLILGCTAVRAARYRKDSACPSCRPSYGVYFHQVGQKKYLTSLITLYLCSKQTFSIPNFEYIYVYRLMDFLRMFCTFSHTHRSSHLDHLDCICHRQRVTLHDWFFFFRVSGSELVQKFIGEGSRMVRELFVMAR